MIRTTEDPDMDEISIGQFNLIYNVFSFTFATMLAATVFFWLGRAQVGEKYKTALAITGLVTFIAAYHYLRIFQSWEASFEYTATGIQPTNQPFNDAYRYVDWLLTVPLLLVELILVMGLSRAETIDKSVRLGLLAALMIVLGYPGEVSTSTGWQLLFGVLSMIPFLWIVYELYVGLRASIDRQPEDVKDLVSQARWVTIGSWAFYPVVYFLAALGLSGAWAQTVIQIGYSAADITSKVVFGLLIYTIAVRKSRAEREAGGGTVPAE
ncbi:MAG: bacteriorhodopsin-like [Paracoccaceae bacterium]